MTRRRAWRRALVGAAILAALVAADQRGWLLARQPGDMAVYHGARARVVRVVDGDTLEVGLPDARQGRATTHVRLWGVSAPAAAGPDRPAEPYAEAAAAAARRLAGGATVTLRLEPRRTRGALGRVLAHVDLPDGRSLNAALLDGGLARTDERRPHARLIRYAQAERRARRDGRGVWGGRPCTGGARASEQ